MKVDNHSRKLQLNVVIEIFAETLQDVNSSLTLQFCNLHKINPTNGNCVSS